MRFQAAGSLTTIGTEVNPVTVPEKTAIEANHGSYGWHTHVAKISLSPGVNYVLKVCKWNSELVY
jgi:hypothetical protein